ncbi:hypothetical protein AGMMS49938_03150 [Fibrobacterales bacterium]|nr:hypothetical protein AGMMS49938_03150 [Fibrobacterales bacterium]
MSLDLVEEEIPPPSFVYGAGYAGRFFAGGIDNYGELSTHYRVNKNWAFGVKGDFNFSRSGFLAGAFGHYLPSGNLFEEQAENFLHFGLDYIKMENAHSPLLSLGYGRDILFWKKSPLGLRMLARLEYAFANHIFSRKNDGLFGMKTIKLANTAFALEIGLWGY